MASGAANYTHGATIVDAKKNPDPEESKKIRELRSKILVEEEMQCATNDWYLLRSLRCTFFDVNNAFKQMKHFWKLQNTRSDVFHGLKDPQFLDWVSESRVASLQTGKSRDGSAVLIFNLRKWDLDEVPSFLHFERLLVLCSLLAAMDPECQKNGIEWIADVFGINWRHLKSSGIGGCVFYGNYCENCTPCSFKRMHILNETYAASLCLKMAATFATDGIIRNHKCYGRNYEELYKQIPKEILPEEYGGLDGPMRADELMSRVHDLII